MFDSIPDPALCSSFVCNETTGSLIGLLSITGNSEIYTPPGAELVPSDLDFPNIIYLSFKDLPISAEFLYHKIENVQSIVYTDFRGIKEINQTLPSYSTIYLDSNCFDNSTFKMSYLNSETISFLIDNSFVNLVNDNPTNLKISSLTMTVNNIPDMSNYYGISTISLFFGPSFNVSSFESNFKTIKAINRYFSTKPLSLEMYFPIEFLKGLYVSPLMFSSISVNLKFNGPTDNKPFNLSNYNIGLLTMENVGYNFNIVDGQNSQFQFPLILDSVSKVVFKNGKISQTKPLSQFGDPFFISVINSTISGDLDIYQPTKGKVSKIYDFSDNSITGTIDPSWCYSILMVPNNMMNGTIPSCFSCYFNYPMNAINDPPVSNFYQGFQGNNFSNLDINIKCTTFAPKIQRITDSTIIIYGDDIGFDGSFYLIDDTAQCNSYAVLEFGKRYQCTSNNSFKEEKGYFKINFKFPFDKDYYFPLIKRSPIITSVSFSNNNNNGGLQVTGSFFSSYLGYVPQSITISKILFEITNSSDFFTIQANPIAIPVNPDSNTFDLLTLNTNSSITRVYINSTSPINNNRCINDCTDDNNGICNLYTGICVCLNGFIGDDCSLLNFFIASVQPSTTNGGEAIFFGSFYTIKCNAQPGNGIKTCSNNGYCNSTTGICKCNNGYTLYDCSALINIDNGGGGGSGTNTTIDTDTGSTNITNSQTHFQIYLKSLIEVDINNNQVKSYSLLKNWIFNKTENEIEPNKYILKQQLVNNNSTSSNGCIITSTIEEIKDENGKEFTFAGTSFIVSSGSIKFTISISNYQYQSSLNTLKLELISSVDKIDQINNCNSKDTEIDTSNVNDQSTFNYIRISKNNKIFSGRFINKVLSDGRSTFFSTNTRNDSNSIIVTLNLPHFSNDFKSECGNGISSRKWFLPVVVVVPILGVTFLFIVFFILYKKSTTFKIIVHASKLKKLNK
ncbi:hypothetical protein ACTA71_006990 [Dictyostelium dimigraforme]